MNYNNLLKFKLQKNSKIPLNKGWTNPANLSPDIDMKYGYNVGVATGRINITYCIIIYNKMGKKVPNKNFKDQVFISLK